MLKSAKEAREVITDILQGDPRSVYRRNKCKDRPFWIRLDTMNITAWFVDTPQGTVAVVAEIEPWTGIFKGNTIDYAAQFQEVVAEYHDRQHHQQN
jgi:hypothetical protein